MLDTGYSTFELRCRAVAAVERGEPQARVAAAFGIDRITLYRWLRRFRAEGARGLTRRPVNGRPRLGAELDLACWRGIVASPASDFGFDTDLWTVPRVRIAAAERYGAGLPR